MILLTCSTTNRNTYSTAAADEINLLAAANGFSNPVNEREEAQYLDWFKDQIQSCVPEIGANLRICTEEYFDEEDEESFDAYEYSKPYECVLID